MQTGTDKLLGCGTQSLVAMGQEKVREKIIFQGQGKVRIFNLVRENENVKKKSGKSDHGQGK